MLRIIDERELQHRMRLRRITVFALLAVGVLLGTIGTAGGPELSPVPTAHSGEWTELRSETAPAREDHWCQLPPRRSLRMDCGISVDF